MTDLRIVDETYLANPQEFVPLPSYNWDERPATLPLDYDEIATALLLAHGSPALAATLLKVPLHRLNRAVRSHPRLNPLLEELNQTIVLRARSVAIDTLFDPNADARRLEWASTKILASRIASQDPFAPAPPSSPSTSLTVTRNAVTYRWRSEADLAPSDPDAA